MSVAYSAKSNGAPTEIASGFFVPYGFSNTERLGTSSELRKLVIRIQRLLQSRKHSRRAGTAEQDPGGITEGRAAEIQLPKQEIQRFLVGMSDPCNATRQAISPSRADRLQRIVQLLESSESNWDLHQYVIGVGPSETGALAPKGIRLDQCPPRMVFE